MFEQIDIYKELYFGGLVLITKPWPGFAMVTLKYSAPEKFHYLVQLPDKTYTSCTTTNAAWTVQNLKEYIINNGGKFKYYGPECLTIKVDGKVWDSSVKLSKLNDGGTFVVEASAARPPRSKTRLREIHQQIALLVSMYTK